MKILVTGGAGFLGSHIVDLLVQQRHEVTVVDNLSGGSLENLPPGIQFVQADVADPAIVQAIGDIAPEAIVHAAAQVSVLVSMQNPDRDRAVNVVGTEHVLQGARLSGTRRFVFISSGGAIYGETEGADEAALPNPQSYYAIHKYTAERYVELSGLPYGIARPANIYGPRQRTDLEGGVVAIFARRLQERLPITLHGSGEQSRDFVHVTDVARAVLAMLESDRDGVWNVGTGTSTTIRRLLSLLEDIIAPAVSVTSEPARPGDVQHSRLLVERASAELGWEPEVSLEAGLSDLARHLSTS